MATYDYLDFLDSEKSNLYSLENMEEKNKFLSRKETENYGEKKIKFKANFELVKGDNGVQFLPICKANTFIFKNISHSS
jgi:hypothetical protein